MSVIDPAIPQDPFPAKPLAMDAADVADNFDRRIHRLEQLLTGSFAGQLSYTAGGNFPGGVTVGGIPIDSVPPDVVTNVVATPGTFFDAIYVDVTWDEAITGPNAVSFDVDIAEVDILGPTYTILNVFNTGATNIRINNLEPNHLYAVRVSPVNGIGVRGTPSAWLSFISVPDSTIPPAPTGLVIARGATTVIVKFTGLTDSQAPDVAWGHGTYEIQIDTANTFATGQFRSMISTATVVAFSDIVGELPQWYARVRAIDSSGNASAWSATAGPSGAAGGVNDSMIVADLSAAKIQFGTMSGDRIAVNTLDAGAIKTSSLTAANITLAGGSLRAGNPPTTGLLVNSQGLRLYQGGVQKMILDATTGNATFSGTIGAASMVSGSITGGTIIGALYKTAYSGQRLEILGDASLPGRLDYYTGSAYEVDNGFLYFDYDNGGTAWIKGRVVLAPAQFTGSIEDQESIPFLRMDSASADGVHYSGVFLRAGECYLKLNSVSDPYDKDRDSVLVGYRDLLLYSTTRDVVISADRGLYFYGASEIVMENNARVEGLFRTHRYYGIQGTGDGVEFVDNSGQNWSFDFDGTYLYFNVNGIGYGIPV